MVVFEIDGKAYDKVAVVELKRSFTVLDTSNSGRTIADGKMHRDIIGTYYNYELALKVLDIQQYDELYEILSAPQDSHLIKIPYAQGYKTFDAYVTDGNDTLQRMDVSGNHWIGLTIKFVAMEANRIP